MEELFRFSIVRSPTPLAGTAAPSAAMPSSDLQQALTGAATGQDPAGATAAALTAFESGPDFIVDPDADGVAKQVLDFANAAAKAGDENKFAAAAKKHLGTDLAAFVASQPFKQLRRRSADSVVAATFSARSARSDRLLALLRVVHVMAKAKDRNDYVARTKKTAGLPVELPGTIFPPRSGAATADATGGSGGTQASAPVPDPSAAIRASLDQLKRARSEIAAHMSAPSIRTERVSRAAGAAEVHLGQAASPMRIPIAVSRKLRPEALSGETQGLLHNMQLDLDLDLPDFQAILDGMEQKLHRDLAAVPQNIATTATHFKVGSGYLPPAPPVEPDFDDDPPPILSALHGALEALAPGDLLVVKQNLVRYEASDIAHVENVMPGEFRGHETGRSRTVEDFTSDESEKTTDEQRDLQTTDRFELRRESELVIKEDTSVTAGLNLSAKYGQTLQINTNLGVAHSEAKEESRKQAQVHSKDVVSRAASKITERTLKLISRKAIEKFWEKDQHRFEGGDDPVTGVYQWLNKVYEAQVYNYGVRAMYNIVVPEPGAFLLDALMNSRSPNARISEPPLFTLTPAQISSAPFDLLKDAAGNPIPDAPSSYDHFVRLYHAQGVKPPPPLLRLVSESVSAQIKGGGEEGGGGANVKEAKIVIPGGYVAKKVHLRWDGHADQEDWRISFHLGTASFLFKAVMDEPTTLEADLPGIDTAVPIAVKALHIVDFAATVTVECAATPELISQWQVDTHNAITQAYHKQLAEFEGALEAAAIRDEEIRRWGANPGARKKLIHEEIKKHCLSILTRKHPGWTGAIKELFEKGPQRYPQPDLDLVDTRASYIQFFEQAFEWEHLTYLLYPYFWGRKQNWYQRALIDDPDPSFAEFLKAGAARIVLPVRLGFELAVAHFLTTRNLWNENNDTATVTTELMSVIEEIKASADVAGTPPDPVGDSWEVVVPTSLVRLRTKKTLPAWTKDGSVPVPKYVPADWSNGALVVAPDRE